MSWANIQPIFHIDILSIIMIVLVSFIGIVVYCFSRTYMKGDALYNIFLRNTLILVASVIFMTIADNLLLFLALWCGCNGMLTQLMVHKSTWKAARASGRLALQNFILGFLFIVLAFGLFYKATGSLSIHLIIENPSHSWYSQIALIMLLIGAMTQSAIWPFHRWLTSSLNSPTPVSALMHAGIVNGGGFVLARFAPLYLHAPEILHIIFILGLITALLGSLWKFMQQDVKRMLACSTMAQMGFMFVQFGLGLFSSAIAHLCSHAMFKAYLFLSSSSAAQEKRVNLNRRPNFICFLCSIACGASSTYIFMIINHKNLLPLDSSLIIVSIVFIAGVQLALVVLHDSFFTRLPIAFFFTAIMGSVYGANVYFFDLILSPLKMMQLQPLTTFYIIGLIMLVLAWLSMRLIQYANDQAALPDWLLRSYVTIFNASQPHPSTITTCRKGYDYV